MGMPLEEELAVVLRITRRHSSDQNGFSRVKVVWAANELRGDQLSVPEQVGNQAVRRARGDAHSNSCRCRCQWIERAWRALLHIHDRLIGRFGQQKGIVILPR